MKIEVKKMEKKGEVSDNSGDESIRVLENSSPESRPWMMKKIKEGRFIVGD